jgi:transcriptional regulator with XRE-family HTH domain
MKLGQRIKERRKALNITQEQLARALKVTPQHISAIEKDKRVPSLSFIIRMAKELGVSIDYLVSGTDGIITDIIPAVKADGKLKLNVKKAIIELVNELSTAD